MEKILSYDTSLLKKQIAENSKLIDRYIEELKEIDQFLKDFESDRAVS